MFGACGRAMVLASALCVSAMEGLGAQETVKPAQVLVGYAQEFIAQRDEMASPLRYAGSGSLYQIGLLLGGESSLGVTAGFSRPVLTSSITSSGTNLERGPRADLSFWYLRPLHRFREDRLRLLGGAQVDLRFAAREHVYTSTTGGSFFHGLGLVQAAGGLEYESPSGRVVRYRLALSVMAVGLRNPLPGLSRVSSPTVKGPWNAPGVDQSVGISFPLWESYDVHLSYRASFFSYPDPRDLSVAADRFGVWLGKKVGRAP